MLRNESFEFQNILENYVAGSPPWNARELFERKYNLNLSCFLCVVHTVEDTLLFSVWNVGTTLTSC